MLWATQPNLVSLFGFLFFCSDCAFTIAWVMYITAPWTKSLSPFLTNLLVAESGKTMAQHLAAPIGEGAYQSAEAVAERTKDSSRDCEKANWKDCYQRRRI